MNFSQKQILRTLRRGLFFLREYFFPFGCALCGTGLLDTEETWYGLCENCRRTLERDIAGFRSEEHCTCCGRPLISEHGRCLSCRNAGEAGEVCAFDRAAVLFPYTGKYRQLLSAYKFGKNRALGHFFAEQIQGHAEKLDAFQRVLRIACDTIFFSFFYEKLRKNDNNVAPKNARLRFSVLPQESAGDAFVLVPVPPRPGKIKKTGWDQVEQLARLLEKNLPLSRCLKRLPSGVQKELNRAERKKNLLGRITVRKSPPKRALVFDDVMTTGSTLDVCAAALKAAGAETVYGFCLFHG